MSLQRGATLWNLGAVQNLHSDPAIAIRWSQYLLSINLEEMLVGVVEMRPADSFRSCTISILRICCISGYFITFLPTFSCDF